VGKRPVEQDSSFGQGIYIRRLQVFAAVTAQAISPERVDGDQKNVGTGIFFGLTARRIKAQKHQAEDNNNWLTEHSRFHRIYPTVFRSGKGGR
jgi:hypothetical protein